MASLSMRNTGTSAYVTITAEPMRLHLYHSVASVKTAMQVEPPSLNVAGAVSTSMTNWIQPWPIWNYGKITEPKFDGICKKIGTISNRPDLISGYHFIGLMRNIDMALAPNYEADITASSSGAPQFSTPPVLRTGGL